MIGMDLDPYKCTFEEKRFFELVKTIPFYNHKINTLQRWWNSVQLS